MTKCKMEKVPALASKRVSFFKTVLVFTETTQGARGEKLVKIRLVRRLHLHAMRLIGHEFYKTLLKLETKHLWKKGTSWSLLMTVESAGSNAIKSSVVRFWIFRDSFAVKSKVVAGVLLMEFYLSITLLSLGFMILGRCWKPEKISLRWPQIDLRDIQQIRVSCKRLLVLKVVEDITGLWYTRRLYWKCFRENIEGREWNITFPEL